MLGAIVLLGVLEALPACLVAFWSVTNILENKEEEKEGERKKKHSIEYIS